MMSTKSTEALALCELEDGKISGDGRFCWINSVHNAQNTNCFTIECLANT